VIRFSKRGSMEKTRAGSRMRRAPDSKNLVGDLDQDMHGTLKHHRFLCCLWLLSAGMAAARMYASPPSTATTEGATPRQLRTESPMKRLRPEAFERARRFLDTTARPIDRALFERRFQGAPAERVLAALAPYQNDDGGFGHGLEPDLRTPASSALATGIGLRLLDEMGCDGNHPMVRRAVRYLVETYDGSSNVWRVIPGNANEHPHAPWWHDDGTSLARTFDGYRIIPRAEIVGLLHRYSALVSPSWLNDTTEHAVAYVESVARLGTGGGDDLLYAIMLAETQELPERFKARLIARIRRVIPEVVVRDPDKWNSYCIMPLKIAPSPQSLAAALLEDVLPINLDYLIERQAADGAWEPTWSWGELYPEAWKEAKREWRGSLTLDALTTLRAYDRIDR
jgi:hypothetical protein